MTPNLFAYLALIAWPIVALFFYIRQPVSRATLWTILLGQLLLPVGTSIKFEMIPVFDKTSIPNMCALVGCIFFTPRLWREGNRAGLVELLIVLFLFSPFATSLANGDAINIGQTVLPGVGVYDGISAVEFQFITLIPFLLGRRFVRGEPDTRQLFHVLTLAGLAYSVLLLFEIRFSPQLHYLVYGYYPSDFIQEVRGGGGFRPMAFMGHGLIASFFAMTAAVASATLWRARIRVVKGVPAGALVAYLNMVLILCKSGAAIVYGLVLVPLVSWTKPRLQMRVAVAIVGIVLTYPVLRTWDLFPTNTVLEIAQTFSKDRATSLQVRFDQEKQLLERASQRLLLGWGRFGRNRVFYEDWQGLGVDSSITDGLWVIVLGQFGIVGFFAEFGLLAISVFRAARALRLARSVTESLFLSSLALIVAINMMDLLPNSALSPWSWLLVGSLLGRSETIAARSQSRKVQRSSPIEFQANGVTSQCCQSI